MSGTVMMTTLTSGWASRIVATARSRFASARGPTSRNAASGSGVFIALMKSLPPMKTTTRRTSPRATCAASPVCWPVAIRSSVVASLRAQLYSKP